MDPEKERFGLGIVLRCRNEGRGYLDSLKQPNNLHSKTTMCPHASQIRSPKYNDNLFPTYPTLKSLKSALELVPQVTPMKIMQNKLESLQCSLENISMFNTFHFVDVAPIKTLLYGLARALSKVDCQLGGGMHNFKIFWFTTQGILRSLFSLGLIWILFLFF